MTHSPLTIARRHVLGDLYSKCDAVESVPVFLNSAEGERLGFVDESHGHYADAFTFHLPEDICKKLSTGHYTFSFDYDHSDSELSGREKRIRLLRICLIGRVTEEPIGSRARRAV